LIAIDTHVWVWFLLGDPRLNPDIAGQISAETQLSSVCLWEAMMLLEKGRLESPFSPSETIRRWLEAAPMRIVPVDGEIAILSRTLQFEHEDPADRFIAASAFRQGAPLATADARLLRLNWLSAVEARI
jgi:PIN domain nuclease of toxin-antitoxin system